MSRQVVAGALMRHAEPDTYDETEGGVELLRLDTDQVIAAMPDGDAVVRALLWVAWWDGTQETDARARAVAEEIGCA